MEHSKPDHGTPDKPVSVATEEDQAYWTYRLHCTRKELFDAVESVGSDPRNVADYIHLVRGEREE